MSKIAILDFIISQILLAEGVHHHAKFHQNWSIRCRYIAIFRFLADRTIGHAFGTMCRLSVVRLSVCL